MPHQFFALALVTLHLLLACTSAQAIDTVSPCQSNATLRISFLNVGQGDATLVSCLIENRHLLIDAGDSSARFPNAQALLKQTLSQRLEEKKLDYGIATHPHLDHVYGFLGLLQDRFQIAEFVDNGEHGEIAHIYRKIKTAVANRHGKISSVALGQQRDIQLCQTLHIKLTSPAKALAPALNCPANFNDCSLNADITVSTQAGATFHVAVLADKTYGWEKVVLQNDALQSASVLRLGHHANLSTSTALLEKIKPGFAIFSAGQAIGENAAFGYPRLDTIENLNRYFTNRFGSNFHKELVNVCNWQSTQCVWQKTALHERILDTRNGTIDLFISDESFCIAQ